MSCVNRSMTNSWLLGSGGSEFSEFSEFSEISEFSEFSECVNA